MAQAFADKGYNVVSGGTDNHIVLIDLRTKFPALTGKVAEKALVEADITTNKIWCPSIAVRLSRHPVFVLVRLPSQRVAPKRN